MALENGKKLGPYEIMEPAGVGGMGEVYKARDTRLDRTVAIKVLPDSMALNADLKTRFDREAKAISSLNHPNICTLHDIGSEEGVDFLVMEFLEGETLADRLQRGPLELNAVYDIAIEISDALDKAHRQGLIHRDLKPGNIMLTSEGAKLMDFGLAKLQLGDEQGRAKAQITQTTPLTGAGTILGTLQYMAPEQLEGEEADARSDIFSFGVVLYEMLTGVKAFAGKSQASLIASIISQEPSAVSEIKPMTPPGLSRLVKKCLEKEPDNRWQSARDLADELRWMAQAGSQVGLPAHVARRRKFKFTVARVVGAVAIVTSLVLAYLLFMQPPEFRHTNRFIISPTLESPEIRSVNWSRISPDGRLIAFRATDTMGVNMLWIRPMNSLEPYPLRGTEDITRQFWSPDSKYIGFFKSNQLYKIPVAGGPAQLLCETYGADGNWGSAGYILFDGLSTDTLKYVSAAGGTPQYATKIDTSMGGRSSAWPWFLSDGIHFLYILFTQTGSQLRVGSLESDASTLIFDEAEMRLLESRVEFCKAGYLLFIKDKLLLAQRFDENEFKLIGEPVPVAQGIDQSGNTSTFGTSDNGVLLYQYASTSSRAELVWVDREGKDLEKVGEPGPYRDISLSPDNSKVVYGLFDERGSNEDLWVYDFNRKLVSRLTFDKPDNLIPRWSPDGKYVAYAEGGGMFSTKYKRADGQGSVTTIGGADSLNNAPTHWFSDSILYLTVTSNDLDIVRYDFADSSVTPVIATQYREVLGSVSRNGKYILYMSNESGRNEIYVSELGGDHGRWQVSNGGGYAPQWRPDNTEIFYFQASDLMAVDVTIDADRFEIGLPKKLFTRQLNFAGVVSSTRYVPAHDGQRFLLNVPLLTQSDDRIVVVQNWIEELEQR